MGDQQTRRAMLFRSQGETTGRGQLDIINDADNEGRTIRLEPLLQRPKCILGIAGFSQRLDFGFESQSIGVS